MEKKAALSLSVNAIIVFVLAFAMLGVGLTVTSLLSEKVTSGIGNLPTDELVIQQPSSTDPITLPNNVDLKRKGEEKIQFAYYNKGQATAYAATIGIATCKYSGTEGQSSLTELELPLVLSSAQDVPASESVGYLAAIQDSYGLSAGTYVCTLIIYNGDASTGYATASSAYLDRINNADAVYEQQQFFLNIVT